MKQVNFSELRDIVKEYTDSGLHRIFLHWSAGHYGQISSAYHISIDKNGEVYVMHPLNERLSATWQRNTGSINISLMGCWDARVWSRTDYDLGSEPPTIAQVAAMAKCVAVICDEMGWDIESPRVMTHGEIADYDGYGVDGPDPDFRWDLLGVPDSDGEIKPGGDVIRGMAIWFDNNRDAI